MIIKNIYTTAGAALIALIILVGGLFLIYGFYDESYKSNVLAASVCVPYVQSVAIGATTAYVLDIKKEKILFEKEAGQQMPLASLTKLMTTLVASEILDQDALVTISPESLTPEGDSGLLAGEMWEVKDLTAFTLITSSNDGAHALALASTQEMRKPPSEFQALMNAKARELNLTQTYFLNDTGLDVSSTTAGAYGSARDVAYLLSYANYLAPNIFNGSIDLEQTFTSVSGFIHEATHTTSLVGELAGGVIAKTGFTDLAGGNLGIIAEPILGRPVAIVVLQSSLQGREEDIKKLYTYAKKVLKYDALCTSL